MKYCAHGPLGLMALAWPKLQGPAKLPLRPGLLGLAARTRSRGEAPMARRRRWPLIPVAGGTGRWGNRSGSTAAEWGPYLRGWGRTGAHREIGPWRCTLVRGNDGEGVIRWGWWGCRVLWCDDGARGGRRAPVPWPDSAVPCDVLATMEGGGGELIGGAPAVDSPRGQKHLLDSDARHTRTVVVGLNQQLVSARSRGAEWQGWRCAVQLDKAMRSEGGPDSGVLQLGPVRCSTERRLKTARGD
jgi:hypothetical protein